MDFEGRTRRLLLVPLQLPDAAQAQELFPRWEIVRYLQNRVPWPYPPNGAEEYFREVALPQVERGEAWHWTIRLATGPERLIGMISLMRGEDNRGFWLGLPWHRQGIMTEACVWANDFWFERLGMPLLRVSKAADNLASRRISLKQGMRLTGAGEKNYVAGRLKSETWELSADEWKSWKMRQEPEKIAAGD
jgi:RimJ/RimL family protein N-acetyltransferase